MALEQDLKALGMGTSEVEAQPSPTDAAPSEDSPLPTIDPLDLSGEEGTLTTEEAVEQHLAALNPQQKQFLAEHLTPNGAMLISLFGGSEVFEALQPYVDQSKILVPMPVEEFEKLRGSTQQTSQPQQPSPPPSVEATSQPNPQSVNIPPS